MGLSLMPNGWRCALGNQIIQPSFTGGELSPSLWGRVDVARYQTSLNTCLNWIVRPYGGVSNRPGTKYLAEVKDSADYVRLIPFNFNAQQSYVLELGDLYFRIYTNGGQLVYSSGDHVGEPVEVVTPWADDDLFEIQFTQSADVMTLVHPDYPPYEIKRLGAESWTCTEIAFTSGPFQTVNSDSLLSVYASGTSGTITLTGSTAGFFQDYHEGQLLYLEQSNYGQPWEVEKTIVAGEIRRSNGSYYTALTSGTTGTLRPIQTTGQWDDGGIRWAYRHSGFGIVRITSASGITATASVVTVVPDGCVVATPGGDKSIFSIATSPAGSVRCIVNLHGYDHGSFVNFNITTSDGDIYEGNTNIYVVDSNTIDLNTYIPDAKMSVFSGGTVALASATGAQGTTRWAFSAFGGNQGYPSSVAYHEQRLVFAGTTELPQSVWMSRTGSFHDFSQSNPIQDDDSVAFTLASQRIDRIRTMLPMNRLILLTAGGEWVLGNGQDVITPTNVNILLQGFRGASSLAPIGIGNTAVYLQDKAKVVRDLGYEFASDSYTGFDLMTFAGHVTEGYSIVDWTFQQSPDYCIWAVRDDGTMLGLTYLREQQIVGWHRHTTEGGTYESVCCIPEDGEDILYVAVKRDGGRYIERMATRSVTDVKDAFFVDSGLTFDGHNTSATTITLSGGTDWTYEEEITITASTSTFAYPATTDVGDQIVFEDDDITYRLDIISTSSSTVATGRPNRTIPAAYRSTPRTDWAWARNTITGLGHLEGETVVVLADGNTQNEKTVTSGAITLDPPAVIVHAGLPITSDLKTLDLSVPGIETILAKSKVITAVRMLVNETSTVKAGRTYDDLYEAKIRSEENYDQPINLATGVVEIRIDTNWGTGGQICVRHTDPLPISILALIPEVTVGG